MDTTDRIEYSKEFDNYFEKQPYDTQIHEEFIEPYDENTFWDELIERLAVRDVIARVGENAISAIGWNGSN